MVIIEKSEFKGNKLIVLKRTAEDTFPFQFGLQKAKLILEAIDEIKAFVEEQEELKASLN